MTETESIKQLFELEDGRFVELLQTEEHLVVVVPAMTKWESKTTLRFTKTHLVIARRFLFIPIWRRIPLNRVGQASCILTDDLYWNWPADTVRIPYGKDSAVDIICIKTCDDQKKLAALINHFLTSAR